MLPPIRAAVGPDFPLLFDSGVRNGEAVLKALALGADFVLVGRPMLYVMGAGGETGALAAGSVTAPELAALSPSPARSSASSSSVSAK